MGEVGLYTALSGIDAETTAMDATSNNVANANTAGYVREQAQFATVPNGGVLVAGIQQVTSQLQQANALSATSSSSDLRRRASPASRRCPASSLSHSS